MSDIFDDIYETYMDEPEGGKHDAHYVTRDIFRLLGYIEGVREGIKLATPTTEDAG